MLEQPKAGLISRFYRQVENRLKKIQTLVYPLSPSKKDGKIQAASKEAAGVDSVHSTTTHIYPL